MEDLLVLLLVLLVLGLVLVLLLILLLLRLVLGLVLALGNLNLVTGIVSDLGYGMLSENINVREACRNGRYPEPLRSRGHPHPSWTSRGPG